MSSTRSLRRLSVALCVLLCVCGSLPCHGAFQIRCRTVAGQTYVFLRDVATYYGMQLKRAGSGATLVSRYSDLHFTRNRRESSINGVTVHLSFAPALWEGELLMAKQDFEGLLNPVLRRQDLPRHRVTAILLDPGHGGRDQGAKGKRYEEKLLTLQIARRTRDALRARGYHVDLTRDGDVGRSLSQRVSDMERTRPDLFLSIHANAVGTSRVQGLEVFLLTPKGAPSTYGSSSKHGGSRGNRFDLLNARLAYDVQHGLLKGTSCADRGVKHARFLVLREATCPAVLIETGFLSNPEEERRLGSAAYQDRIARGIVAGVTRFSEAVAP